MYQKINRHMRLGLVAAISLVFSPNTFAIECNQTESHVCGEDGQTYKNGCLAFAANVRTVHDGACGAANIATTLPPISVDEPEEEPKYCVIAPLGEPDSQDQPVGSVSVNCLTPGDVPNNEHVEQPPVVTSTVVDSCAGAYVPVCGANGRNYYNTCNAEKAGMAVAHTGLCASAAVTTHQCNSGSPQVCGEDGNTYINQCTAALAGAQVVHTGGCLVAPVVVSEYIPEPISEPIPEIVSEPTPIAELEPVVTPAICSTNSAPVCGQDGNTYLNACTALEQNVVIATAGACVVELEVAPAPAPLIEAQPNHTHKSTQYPYDNYHYGYSSGSSYGYYPPAYPYGYSYSYPYYQNQCSSRRSPVCGRDGYTYRNHCYARSAGVSVRYSGSCRSRPTGHGQHGGGQPQGCSNHRRTVCGSNGSNYRNACVARRSGVSVRHSGRCGRRNYPNGSGWGHGSGGGSGHGSGSGSGHDSGPSNGHRGNSDRPRRTNQRRRELRSERRQQRRNGQQHRQGRHQSRNNRSGWWKKPNRRRVK